MLLFLAWLGSLCVPLCRLSEKKCVLKCVNASSVRNRKYIFPPLSIPRPPVAHLPNRAKIVDLRQRHQRQTAARAHSASLAPHLSLMYRGRVVNFGLESDHLLSLLLHRQNVSTQLSPALPPGGSPLKRGLSEVKIVFRRICGIECFTFCRASPCRSFSNGGHTVPWSGRTGACNGTCTMRHSRRVSE